MLKEFVKNGGRVCLYDGKPMYVDGAPAGDAYDFLEPNATLDDVYALRDVVISCGGRNVPGIRKMSRTTDDGRVVFLTNVGGEDCYPVEVTLPAGLWAELDVASLELKPVYTENGSAVLRFNEGESHVLVTVSEDEYAALPKAERPTLCDSFISVPSSVRLTDKVENIITLDFASRSNDGVNYEEPMFLMGIKDNLLREKYNGRVWLKFTYDVAEGYVPNDLRVAIEPMFERVTVNGEEVKIDTTDWWYDRHFGTADIAPLTHAGRNEIIVEVNHYQRDFVYYVLSGGDAGAPESLRNCLLFDTEVENIYLVGDFGVKTDAPFKSGDKPNTLVYEGGFVLCEQPKTVPSDDVVHGGFPFFAGKLPIEFEYDYRAGMPTVLPLDGRHAIADVTVNGESAGKLLFDKELDLAPWLKDGRNTISVTICNSMRNTMGPHHRGDHEPYAVGPPTYSWEREWNGRECKDFYERYAFVKYGIVK